MSSIGNSPQVLQLNGLQTVSSSTNITEPATQPTQRPSDAMQSTPEDLTGPSQPSLSVSETDNSNVKRRASKLGIFSLFNRSKLTFDFETPQENLETEWHGIVSTERPVTRDEQSAYIPSENEASPTQQSSEIALRRHSSKGALRNKASFKRESRSFATWTPPPLFQAYPQAIKYATLRGPSLSAEAVLRQNREKSARPTGREENGRLENPAGVSDEKAENKEKKLKKSIADVLTHGGWTDKIYVLVTSGFLLQYPGNGNFDRLPEKVLPLTETSAAFASDVIPGKPFVLQVSQVSNEDGTIDMDLSKSIFKKLGLRNEIKRSTSSFLLVLEGPKEMDEWLVAIRREIEALGGQDHKSDVLPSAAETTPVPALPRVPSQRYLVKRDPFLYSKGLQSPVEKEQGGEPKALEPEQGNRSSRKSNPNRQSSTTQASRESRYISDTQASIDQVHLNRLRESYSSTAEGTTSTSRDSSPERPQNRRSEQIAPPVAKTIDVDFSFFGTSPLLDQTAFQNPNADRESLQPTPTPNSRPVSIQPSAPSRTTSPPNFSVPTFSKRFSATSGSSGPSVKTHPPPMVLHSSPPLKENEEGDMFSEATTMSPLPGDFYLRPKSSSIANKRISSPQSGSFLGSPPTSSHSHESFTDAHRRYSQRFSSLEYSRGISPVKVTAHSPSPHPPPTGPLPPIPTGAQVLKRGSLIPPPKAPPTCPLPALPVLSHSPQSSNSPSPPLATPPLASPPASGQSLSAASSDVGLPLQKPPSLAASLATSPEPSPTLPSSVTSPALRDSGFSSLSPKRETWTPASKSVLEKPKGLRRPGSTQVRPLLHSSTGVQNALGIMSPVPLAEPMLLPSPPSSPPQPSREPPAPPPIPVPTVPKDPVRPPTPPKLHKMKSMPRIGREPPPVSTPHKSVGSKRSSGLSSPPPQSPVSFEPTPLPLIPPIRVSNRKSRSSFDGPWNSEFESSFSFLNLSVK